LLVSPVRGWIVTAAVTGLLLLSAPRCRADPALQFSDQALIAGVRSKSLSEGRLKGRRIILTGTPVEVGSGAILFAPPGPGTKIRADLEPGGMAPTLRVGEPARLECTFAGKKTFGPIVLESCIDLGPPATTKNLFAETLARRREVGEAAAEAAAEDEKPSPLADPGSAAAPSPPSASTAPTPPPVRSEKLNFRSNDHGVLFLLGLLVVGVAVTATVFWLANWAFRLYIGHLEEVYAYRFWTWRLVLVFAAVGFLMTHVGLDPPIHESWPLLGAAILTTMALLLNISEVGLLHGALVTAIQVLAGATMVIALFGLMGIITRFSRRNRE
jgi:hypothetical protein